MSRHLWIVGVLAAMALGLALRLPALGGEFWLDEILSWQLARQASSPAGVLTVRHDNNHHLNTAWLTLWPDAASRVVYRLHAVVAGLASVVAAGWVARRWGGAEAGFASVLVASNYWLVLASSEARGYTLAVLFALLSYAALRQYLDDRNWLSLLAFWLACILGFLSHLTFVFAYIGYIVWSMRRFARERRRPGEELVSLVTCHMGVATFFALFYLFCIRGMEIAGAPPAPLLPVVERLVVVGLGGPEDSWWGLAWVAAFCATGVAGLRLLHREGSDVWVFFAVCVFAAPALFFLRKPPFLFERYFLIPFVFFLLLAAHVLGSMWRTGSLSRFAALALLLIVVAGHVLHVTAFVRVGRGQFTEALAWVLEVDPSAQVTITGDHDFRVRRYVEFYARYQPEREVVYSTREDGAEWLIAHRLDHRQPPAAVERDAAGQAYHLVRSYPSGGPGAWGWFVYRRAPQ